MTTEQISCAPGSSTNEDLIAVVESDGVCDLVMLDGASSVADTNYIDREHGDVAWFVRAFSAALAQANVPGMRQGGAVRRAVDAVRARYRAQAAGAAIPVYAYPLAALAWVRIRQRDDHLALSLYCLGDCKVFAIDAAGAVRDLAPWVNPQEAVLQGAIGALTAEDLADPALRRARLLPMLRARRAAQHEAPAPNALCLAPQGEFDARETSVRLAPGSSVLVMSDGFYRLVDPYGLYTIETLAQRCRDGALAALMDELRLFEKARAPGMLAVKNADDASAVLWTGQPLTEGMKNDVV